MWNQRWNLYNSPSNHKPLSKFNMAATDATIIFLAHSVTLKYDLMFYLTQNWFLCTYSGIVYVILKSGFIVPFHIQNIWKRKTCSCLNHIRGSPLIHLDGGRAGGATCQWAMLCGVLGGRIRTQPLFSPPCVSATYSSAWMCRRKNGCENPGRTPP